jgi:hypothetical protein
MTCFIPRAVSPWFSPRAGLALAAWLMLACVTPAQARCGGELPIRSRLQLEGTGGLQLAFAPRPAPIPVNKPVVLDIVLCAPPGQALPYTLGIEAEMSGSHWPMGKRISVRPLGGGRFTAEGLVFSKAGYWKLNFKLPPAVGMAGMQLSQEVEAR